MRRLDTTARQPAAAVSLAAAATLALLVAQAVDADAFETIVFETLSSPASVGWGPGPDGFIGTSDDVADPDNTPGSLTYAISPTGQLYYSEATTTINEPYVFENGTSTITDFVIEGTLAPGYAFADLNSFLINPDFERAPTHEMLTHHQGRTDGEYTIVVCEGGPCFGPTGPGIVVAGYYNHSGRGRGFLVRPGDDPYLLPGIDSNLAAYLDGLMDTASASDETEDWTAIHVKAGGRLDCANWDPEAEGCRPATQESIEATYEDLLPSDHAVFVQRNSGRRDPNPRYIYANIDLVEELNAKAAEMTYPARLIAIKNLDEAYQRDEPHEDLAMGDPVGIPDNFFSLPPDRECVFFAAGQITTAPGAEDPRIPGGAGEFIPRRFDGRAMGGVVATVSLSPIEFIFEPIPVAIEIRDDEPSEAEFISVAILGSLTFDVADVDVTTLAFGPVGESPAPADASLIEAGELEESTFLEVEFTGSVEPIGDFPDGAVSGTLGVYDAPEGTGALPVVASKISFTAENMSASNGTFTGWKNVGPTVYLDFTGESPVLKGEAAVVDGTLEDDQLAWHLGPARVCGKGDCQEWAGGFERVSTAGFSDSGILTLTTNPVPKPDNLVSSYPIAREAIDGLAACVTGQTLEGLPFVGCVPEPSSGVLQSAALVVMGLLVPRRRCGRSNCR